MNNIRKKWAVTFLCLAVICLAGVLAACTGKTFTVSLDAAGGALAGESSISVKAGDALVLPVPEREDYIFEGWFYGDGPNAGRVADGTSVTADMTLTARWRADFSEGAEYILSADGSSYVCVGTGTFTGAALKLPTFYKGLPVTAVADGAFAENDLLVQVSLPRLLVSVGDGGGETGAFEGCERLQTVTFRGEPIAFAPKEFDIIEFLSQNMGQVFPRERIYERVWGYDGEGDSAVVAEHVRRIRVKFAAAGARAYIETVWGCGYKWARG